MSDLNSLIASLDGDVFALLQEGKSLSELLKELLVLRKQNLALQETERRRKAQFSRLCNGCHIIAKDIFLRPPCMADQLPSELVEEIYRFALPPSGYLEPTLGSGPNSLWFRSIRMKKTLTHVCKAWLPVGRICLYEIVAFCRVGQVIAFAQTLREDTAGLSSLVQKIIINCYVPKCLWDAVLEDLAFILAVCTSVQSLSFTSAFLVSNQFVPQKCILPDTLAAAIFGSDPSTTSRIETLEVPAAHITTTHSPIQTFTPCMNVVSLTLPSHLMMTGSQDATSWPCLEELDIAPPDISSQYIIAEANNVISWEVPRLKRLIVSADLQHLDKFLERHSSNLIFLDIRNTCFPNFDGLELTPILSQLGRLCPDLRHLVFAPNSTGLHCLDEIPLHSSLRYVDIWVTNLDIEACTKTLVDFIASRAIVVRALDSRLIHIRSLPRLLSPTTLSNELPATHNLLGFFIEHEKSCIWLLEGNWPDEQDSQYVEFGSDESVGDSASSNMSDSCSDSGFQLDRQTALAAYRANLETDSDGSDDQSGSNEESPNNDTISKKSQTR